MLQLHTPNNTCTAFDLFNTKDVNEACQWGNRTFQKSNLMKLQEDDLNLQVSYRDLGKISLGRMSYGGRALIEVENLKDFMMVQMPITGHEIIKKEGISYHSYNQCGSILNSNEDIRLLHFKDTEKLILKVDNSLLNKHCQNLISRSLKDDIRFEANIDCTSLEGQKWEQTCEYVFQMLTTIKDVPPILLTQYEELIATSLLLLQGNNYSHLIHQQKSQSVTPGFIRKIEKYIEEHAHEPLTILNIAEYGGISTRTLYAGFKRYRNTTPMLYLKEIRMRNVFDELQHAQSNEITVTEAAFKWGFNHLGHFSTDYKRRFGESPSETLLR